MRVKNVCDQTLVLLEGQSIIIIMFFWFFSKQYMFIFHHSAIGSWSTTAQLCYVNNEVNKTINHPFINKILFLCSNLTNLITIGWCVSKRRILRFDGLCKFRDTGLCIVYFIVFNKIIRHRLFFSLSLSLKKAVRV